MKEDLLTSISWTFLTFLFWPFEEASLIQLHASDQNYRNRSANTLETFLLLTFKLQVQGLLIKRTLANNSQYLSCMCKKLKLAEADIKYMIDDTNQAQMTAIFSMYNSEDKYWWCLVSM